ncbi:MAG TPA: alpha/beta fold hydrolase [Gaiellaceae bacterium]|nr:alpha/beta fold hydrolase [Gaiellaceae bacterium]
MFAAAHRGGSGPPLVLVHGFTDTWRTWELVLPQLERRHDVLAPTLPGHAGGPSLVDLDPATLADGVERALDEAGFETAHIVGNSLGGYVALQLAERGRARSVVAFAPAGGFVDGQAHHREMAEHFTTLHGLATAASPRADAIASTDDGRRRATRYITERHQHIPADLIAHQIRGVAGCDAAALIELAGSDGFPLDADRIDCPVRIVWGADDKILAWPDGAARYRSELPYADWVVLDGVGHCPQLDVPLEAAELILGFTSG